MSPLPIVIAHRGASGYRPEHTRAAYELAIAMGADAVEPDLVVSRDGVLVIRHENEISGTTDVASRPEFAARRTTKSVDGEKLTGWFTEDFTWDELATLRAIERIPKLRPQSAKRDGEQGILRFVDLLALIDASGRSVALVAELKHPTYYASIGVALDDLYAAELEAAGWARDQRLTTECFEKSVLLKVRAKSVGGRIVLLIDAKGSPPDEVAAHGKKAAPYSDYLSEAGLFALAGEVDGVSLHKRIVIPKEADLKTFDGRSPVVDAAHAAGLLVYTWTLRAENKFLSRGATKGPDAASLGNWMLEFGAIMRAGVDGVFCDQPDLGIAARASLVP